jgi:hypothetical protein
MPDKSFEKTIRFYEHYENGDLFFLPLVEVTLVTTTRPVKLALYFDTGASVTTLRKDLYPLLGLNSWDEGVPAITGTGAGNTTVYRYLATIEVFGKTLDCPVQLAPLSPNPLFQGLLGREGIFDQFGFGFWESTRELFVTGTP